MAVLLITNTRAGHKPCYDISTTANSPLSSHYETTLLPLPPLLPSLQPQGVEIAKYTRSVGDPDAKPGDDEGFFGDYGRRGGWCWLPPLTPPHQLPSTYRLGVQKQALTATFIAFTSFVGLGAFILVVWCVIAFLCFAIFRGGKRVF